MRPLGKALLCNVTLAFVAILSIASVSPAPAAQSPSRVPRIGVISEQGPKSSMVEAFRQGLRELGYVEGQSIHVEYRHCRACSIRYRVA